MRMNRKIVGIFLCNLFLVAGIATAAVSIEEEINFEESLGNRLFVFGRMEEIEHTGGSVDFEVISFVFIKQGMEITKLNNNEQIRFYSPMVGILINKIVIGWFSGWEIIE